MINNNQMNIIFVNLAKELGLNPVYLKDILKFRNFGYNNTQIAELTGISRVTINTYIEKIRMAENQEKIGKLILLALGVYLGAKVLEEILS